MFINDKITKDLDNLHSEFDKKKYSLNVTYKDIVKILNKMSTIIEELCQLYNKHFNNSIDVINEYKIEDYIKYINIVYNLLSKSILNEKNSLEAFNLLIKEYVWEFSNNIYAQFYKNYFKMLKDIFFELLEICHYPISFNRNPDRTVQNIITIKRLGRYIITNDEDFILPQLQIPLIRQTIDKYLNEIYGISQLITYNKTKKRLEKYRLDFQHSKSINKSIFRDEEINVLDKIYTWSCRFIHAGYKEKRWFIELCAQTLNLIYHNHHNRCNNRIEIFKAYNKQIKDKNIIVNFDFNFDFEYYNYVKTNKTINSLGTKYIQKTEDIVYEYFDDVDYANVDIDTIEILKVMQSVLVNIYVLIYNIDYFTKAGCIINEKTDTKILNYIEEINKILSSNIIDIQLIEKNISNIQKCYKKLIT